MPLSNYSLDTFVAPHLSQLTACGAAPRRAVAVDFLGQAILSQALVKQLPVHLHVFRMAILRHYVIAAEEYQAFQTELQRYVAASERSVLTHARAIKHLESCILHAHITVECVQGLEGQISQRTEPGPGGELYRLRQLNNCIKHFDRDVAKVIGKKQSPPLAPVWLTNRGVVSPKPRLDYQELVAVLDFLEKLAEGLSE
jgi:hypothetical protein